VSGPHIVTNVHSVAANSAATENAIRRVFERNQVRQREFDASRCYATGGVVGHPELTRLRRATPLRRCIHRFACWLLRY
jgi:hypothetical protein